MPEARRASPVRHLSLVAARQAAIDRGPSPLRAAVVAMALGGCIMAALVGSALLVHGRPAAAVAATGIVQP